MNTTEVLKLALDDLIAEYYMEHSSFARRVDDIFKEALVAPEDSSVVQSEEYKDAIEVSVIFHEGQRMFAVPKQPAQQEPVAAECNFVGTKEWGRCSIEHHNLVQSEPHNWPGYQTRLLYTSPGIKENT